MNTEEMFEQVKALYTASLQAQLKRTRIDAAATILAGIAANPDEHSVTHEDAEHAASLVMHLEDLFGVVELNERHRKPMGEGA